MAFEKPVKTNVSSQDLSVGAGTALLHEYTFIEECCELLSVMIHASTNITETIVVKHHSVDSFTNYVFTLDSTSLSAAANYVFRPTGYCVFNRGDKISVACTGANDTGTVYSKIQYREII